MARQQIARTQPARRDAGAHAGAVAHGRDWPDGPPHGASALTERDHFLRLMFFQASHQATVPAGPGSGTRRATGAYAPLRLWKAKPDTGYHLPERRVGGPVGPDSPALSVMTDLRRVDAVTVGPAHTIDEAHRTMREREVRALFVLDEGRRLIGILTATDVLGERPVLLTQQRGIRHDEVLVRDVMTPAARLEVVDYEELRGARVGDVVATLRASGRQHALAVEVEGDADAGTEDDARNGRHAGIGGATTADARQAVRGIFSLTQIARQLGLPALPMHDIGRTFAEIEAAIRP